MQRLVDVDEVRSLAPETTDYSDEELAFLIDSGLDLIQAYVGFDFAAPLPGRIQRLVIQMVKRTIRQSEESEGIPYGASNMSNTAGPFTRSFGFTSGSNEGGIWLTANDKRILRRYKNRAFTIRTW